MGIAIGRENAANKIAIGDTVCGGIAIGSVLVYTAVVPLTLSWTFTVSSLTSGYAGHLGTQSMGSGGLADGSLADNASEAWRAATASGEQWIELDLGANKTISTVGYAGINGIAAATKNGLSIQTRPNGSSTYTTHATTAGHGLNDTVALEYAVAAANIRYVRIRANGVRINASEFWVL